MKDCKEIKENKPYIYRSIPEEFYQLYENKPLTFTFIEVHTKDMLEHILTGTTKDVKTKVKRNQPNMCLTPTTTIPRLGSDYILLVTTEDNKIVLDKGVTITHLSLHNTFWDEPKGKLKKITKRINIGFDSMYTTFHD